MCSWSALGIVATLSSVPMILAAGADLSSDGASRTQEPDASSIRDPFPCRALGALVSSVSMNGFRAIPHIVALSARRDCERALTVRGNP